MARKNIGPGPGKYLLPPVVGHRDHDPSRYRNPAYSMGIKLDPHHRHIGPGPAYHTEHMTPYGKAHPPAYSVRSRPQELKIFQGPGPAAYTIKDFPKMPAYSISSRNPPLKPFSGPGPDQYEIPSTLGPKVPDLYAKPAYSMRYKFPLRDPAKSPGPARYDATPVNRFKNKQPGYTMRPLWNDLSERYPSPGPSAYYPVSEGPGGYSFGLRTVTLPYITPEDDMPCINK